MPDEGPAQKPISLFYSYSHKDEKLRNRLDDHLAYLRRNDLIAGWHDRKISGGKVWDKEIDRNLTSADIILLLVSSHFIASDYCWGVEVKKALELHGNGEANVIPVILRPCRWETMPFAKLQAAPTGANAVTLWANRDAALNDVARKIEHVVMDLVKKRATVAAAAGLTNRERAARDRALPDAIQRAVTETLSDDFTVFRDGDAPWSPEMVALPAGEFLMGSPESDQESSGSERPQHLVTIGRRFAMGRYPVTFEEFDHFCEETQREKPGDRGWGRDRRPVVFVDWVSAVAYCKWLAHSTGQPYRLPTEAEWEYACRCGTTARYYSGDTITAKHANYTDSGHDRTIDVGAYPSNAWGLYDMLGNVQEWVEDVWHENYEGAPSDETAWTDGEGKHSPCDRVIRSSSWNHYQSCCRSAFRSRHTADTRGYYLGFRVARAL